MTKSKKERKTLTSIKINTVNELSLRLGIPKNILEEASLDIHAHCYKKIDNDKKGKERIFYPPDDTLRGIQMKIQTEILDRLQYSPSFHGGLKKHSIETNAGPHTGKKLVAEFDITNFFPNVSNKIVYRTFIEHGCTPDVARMLTGLTTVDGHMAQGFLTSPKLSVSVLAQIDKRLTNLFKKHGLVHTIWIDNFTVSGAFPIEKLENVIRKIFADSGFTLKEAVYTYQNRKQKVTGAIVNDKVAPPKNTRRSLRKTRYLIGKYGIDSYLMKYYPNSNVNQLQNKLTGQLSWLISLDRIKYLPMHKWFKARFKEQNERK